MKSFYLLENEIKAYSWGDKDHIPRLLGMPNPQRTPQAELWMGAHGGGPSRLVMGEARLPLDQWIARDPPGALGKETAQKYGGLPFLFKLLAAGQALSIQAHPDKAAAREGFAREEAAGIPRDAKERNYRDDNHKPEIILALTPFMGMIGFRPWEEILHNFQSLGSPNLAPGLGDLPQKGGEKELKSFLQSLMTLVPKERENLLAAGLRRARQQGGLPGEWVPRLQEQYPGDIGALAPLYLNTIKLEPGQALYQPARTLHAYLEGFGVELMANSDNVLRGGLTPKHVDLPELLKVLRFQPSSPQIMEGTASKQQGLVLYPAPAQEFLLCRIDLSREAPFTLPGKTSPRILLCLEGEARLGSGEDQLTLPAGASAFLPWAGGDIVLTGEAKLALASLGA